MAGWAHPCADGPPSVPTQPSQLAEASGRSPRCPAPKPDAPTSSVGRAHCRPSTERPTNERVPTAPWVATPAATARWMGAVHHQADEEHLQQPLRRGLAAPRVNLMTSLPPSPTRGWSVDATRAGNSRGVLTQRVQTNAQTWGGRRQEGGSAPDPYPTARTLKQRARATPGVLTTRAGQPRTPRGETEGGGPRPGVDAGGQVSRFWSGCSPTHRVRRNTDLMRRAQGAACLHAQARQPGNHLVQSAPPTPSVGCSPHPGTVRTSYKSPASPPGPAVQPAHS